jgi:cytoskeletal protein CcmA (bactofilin family)
MEQKETERPTDKPEGTASNPPARTYPSSFQGVSPETKPTAEASSSRAITESESLARDIKEGTLSGFVGGGTLVTGEATFKALMRVDGHLSGRVSSTSGTLIVGANGKVDANIEVAIATIHGTVNGDIIASQRLELGRAAKVNGNIQTPTLVIEQGAIFEGSCKMVQMSAEKDKRAQKRDDKPHDTTGVQPISADGATKSAGVTSVSGVAS